MTPDEASHAGTGPARDALLTTLLEHAGPMLALDAAGACHYANPAAVALADGTVRELAGPHAATRLPILADAAVADAIATAWRGAEATAEAMAPGTMRRFAVRAVPSGALVLVYLKETTARWEAEAATARAVEAARLADIAGTTGSYECNFAADTLWLSEQARRMLGFEPAADSTYPRSALADAILPEDRERYAAAVASALADAGAIYDVTCHIRLPGGEIRAVHVVGEVVRDAEGRPRTMVGSVSDVTDRDAAEAALRLSEERLRKTVEGIDAIIAFREDGASPVIQSPQVERILGYRPEDLADNAVWDGLVHPDDAAACAAAWNSQGSSWDLTYRIRRADGKYIWVEDRGRWIERGEGRGRGLIGVVTDITARRRAEEELRAGEERLRRTVEGVDAVITYLESGGGPTVQSPQAERILGYPPEALTTEEAWLALVHPDDLARCVAAWEAGTPTWQITYRMRRADGRWIWVDDRGQRIYHDDGRAPGYVGVLTDVTDRVEAGRERRLADERRRRFFDANIVGTVVVDASGRVHEANDYWLRLVGRSRGELERGELDWRAATAPESRAADDDAIAQCRATGRSRPYEKTYLRPDGTPVPALVVRASVPGADEQFATFTLDLTERNAAAAETAQLAAAIEQTSESVVITDADATIRYVNPAFERASGYTREEAVGQNPRILHSGAHAPEFYLAMWDTLLRGETWRGELVNQRKDGALYTEVAAISPIRDASGRTTAYVSVKRDVTAERALEARLSQAQRLEAIGQLAGGIAHDFNNLLAVIRGYADLARAEVPEGGPAADDLARVVLAADHASALTHQLLAFSRREATEPTALDPAEVVDDLVPMLRRLLGEHIELEVAAAVPSAGCVRIDRSQLDQVAMNLVANARDAMPDGGRLVIRIEPLDDGARWVRLTVSDSGIGMDEATARRAFEPFFTTKGPGHGTGLGLATVYGIVTAAGGRVGLASSPGHGAAVTVDLPSAEPPDADPAAAGAGAADGAGTRADAAGDQPQGPGPEAARPLAVLLVEDDEAVRALTRRMLLSLGHTVTVAASGAEALQLVDGADPSPDVLVTDVRMPGIQGPELARILRDRNADLPVVFTSGFSAELGDSVAIPGAQILDKPFDLCRLDAAVRAAVAAAR